MLCYIGTICEHIDKAEMNQILHLQKLSVGTETVADLAAWQNSKRALTGELPQHVTRMWPKRADEILTGGSMYWVIKGSISCRQKIARFDEAIGADGIRRCAIILEPELIHVAPTLKRPFQGWRYLKASDAPVDLPKGRTSEDPLPASLNAALAEIGVL